MVRDPLTGVYSRVTLSQRLHEEIDRSQRYGLPLTIIMLDLDHYKSVNDAFGHLRGDLVLVDFAERLRQTIRKADILYRYGGDEFLLVLPNTTKEQATILGKRLLVAVQDTPFEGLPPITLTISLGIATFPEDGLTAEDLFTRSDQRHYAAKRNGRNSLVADDPHRQTDLMDADFRLVERDEALHVLKRFLSRLNEAQRGILSVLGGEGSGKHRFLMEVSKIAHLHGYEVMSLHGSPALKNRAFGDLDVVYQNWDTLPSPSEGNEVFIDALVSMIQEKGRSGILFCIDHLHEVDWMTLELVRQLLMERSLPIRIGLVYSAPVDRSLRNQLPSPEVQESVEMLPLSKQGVRIMLRHMLKWEAPEEFTEWLYLQSSGLPGFVLRAAKVLIDLGILEHFESGWTITRSYHSLLLRERLNLQTLTPTHNLPVMPTTFIGRAQEIKRAKELLTNNRLLTIIGPGGIGKTRLAIQVATEILSLFPHGVYWIPLASIKEDLAAAISTALRFSSYSKEDTETQICSYLHNKQSLLILDNFEHLTQDASVLSRLMEAAPQVKIIATTRQRLALHGETLLELNGFDYPTQSSGNSIASYPALQLFVQSARRVSPDFRLNDENKSAIVSICQLVEGSPLGIELAASWVRLLSCAEIVQEIQHNQDFLATDIQDVPDRHRSLRAVFNHSWDLLTSEEQQVLAGLSVFHGGFGRNAAAKVASASITTLIALLDKSLLYKVGEGRYALHEVMAGFGREKLATSPDRYNRMLLAHCQYYTGFLETIEEQLNDLRQVNALELLESEIENLRFAWEYAVTNLLLPEIDRSLHSLYYYYEIRGRAYEGNTLFETAEAAFSQRSDPESQKLTARLKSRRGVFATRLSEYSLASELFEQSMAIMQALGDVREVAFILLSYGISLVQVGSFEQARNILKQSLTMHIEIDHARGIATTLNELGANEYQQGNYPLAEQFHQESLRIFREISDPWGLAQTLSDLGNVESELGDFIKARQYYLESLALSEKIGARLGVATTLNNMGDIARTSGEYSEAQQYLTRSAQVYSELGDRNGLAVATLNLGDTALRLQQFAQAAKFLNQSLCLCVDTRDLQGVAYAQIGLANLAIASQDWHKAATLLDQAMHMAAEHQVTPLLMQSLLTAATLFTQLGELNWSQELVKFILNHPSTLKADRDEAKRLDHLLETLRKEPFTQKPEHENLIHENMTELTLVNLVRSQAFFVSLTHKENA